MSGHAGELGVHPEVVLERHRGERLILLLDADALLRLDSLMQAVRPAPTGHKAPRELVDDDDFAVLDHIVLVPLEHGVSLERLLDGVLRVVVREVVEVVDSERLLDLFLALLSEPGGAMLLFEDVVSRVSAVAGLVALDRLSLLEPGNDAVRFVVLLGRGLGRARDDQRRACLVDQDRVDLVHDREVVPALDMVAGVELHVVAQVVEAELVVGAVGDVRGVARPALLVRQAVDDHPHLQSQPAVDPPHPLRVALGEVVIDGHHVDAAARNRVEVHGERGSQGLPFPGLHLGDLAVVQDLAADQLHVEMAHAHHAPCRLAADCERLGQQLVERLAIRVAPLELLRLGLELVVGKRFRARAKGIDLRDERAEALELALVLGAEDLG